MNARPAIEPFAIHDSVIAPGTRATVAIPVAQQVTGLNSALALEVVHGARHGPCIFVSGAIHGDEIIGTAVIQRLLERLSPGMLAGTIIFAPAVNIYGFVAHSRYLPDRRDLNRSFPGAERGSLAAQLAHCFLTQVIDRCALGIDGVHIWGKPPCGHSFGIGQRNYPVDSDPRPNCRPFKGFEQRFGQRQPRGFDQDMIWPRGERHQGFDSGNEIIGHSTTDAPIGQLDDVFGRAVWNGAGFQNFTIDANVAKFIDNHGQTFALGVLHQVANQRGLSGPEKTGDHRDGKFRQIRHWESPVVVYAQYSFYENGPGVRATEQPRLGWLDTWSHRL